MKRYVLAGALVLSLAAFSGNAAELSVWALQEDMQAAIGVPDASIVPTSLAYNPLADRLLIACGGSDASILEWEEGANAGTVLVSRANWGVGGNPAPFACNYVRSRNAYFVLDGGDDNAVLNVQPGVANQTPDVFLETVAPTFPAGGLPCDSGYCYYKNQWTGLSQQVYRFTTTGTNGVESVHVPDAAFVAANLSGPGQQMVIDSAGDLIIIGRTTTANGDYRGLYRWNEGTQVLEPIVQSADVTAYTGESSVRFYGLAIDRMDTLYFYDIYSAAILAVDRFGMLHTVLTADDIRDFMNDPELSVWPNYMVVVNNRLVFNTGNVSGHVLAARLPLLLDMVTIPVTDFESNGPAYPYAIGKFEITNAQYCTFLNDAQFVQQTDPNDPRCSNMVFFPDGDVYMNADEYYRHRLYWASDFVDSRIFYDATQAIGSRYYVRPYYNHHPAASLSWMGAAKFCNWLTIDQGLGAEERCYGEGSDVADWIPVTAADWTSNGLLPAERRKLVQEYRGYRLPMDGVNYDNGGPNLSQSWNIGTNPYNEWYKAAAFDPAALAVSRPGPGDDEIVPAEHWTFAFGSDVATPADANLGETGYVYPHPNAETTPVGFYNGVNTLADGTVTHDTGNRYGLYDMCGNVDEWITDTVLEYPWDSDYRAMRGGRWAASELKYGTASYRKTAILSYCAENTIGIRLVQTFGYGDFNADGAVNSDDQIVFADAMTGPAGELTPGLGYEACDADGDGDVDLADFAEFQGAFMSQ